MNLRLPRCVISTGPRKAASTTSPDRLLKSVREKCAQGYLLKRDIPRYHDFSYFSYLWVPIKRDFLAKRNTPENQCSINGLHGSQKHVGQRSRHSPRGVPLLVRAAAYDYSLWTRRRYRRLPGIPGKSMVYMASRDCGGRPGAVAFIRLIEIQGRVRALHLDPRRGP